MWGDFSALIGRWVEVRENGKTLGRHEIVGIYIAPTSASLCSVVVVMMDLKNRQLSKIELHSRHEFTLL